MRFILTYINESSDGKIAVYSIKPNRFELLKKEKESHWFDFECIFGHNPWFQDNNFFLIFI